jgi:hypothetical protein
VRPLSIPSAAGRWRAWRRLAALAVAQTALWAGPAAADPGYYVVTVYDDPGLKTIDFRYWTVKLPGAPLITWPEAGFGWNVNGRWYTELLGSFAGESGDTRLDNVEWQNDVLLTQGQYPFDLAVHSLWVTPRGSGTGHSLELGPVLQTDIERTQLNFNLIFDRSFDGATAQPTQLKYQWQVRSRWQHWLNVGAQGFGELGAWDHWAPHDAQSHRAGPALFGSVGAGPGAFAWQAAYLVGKTFGVRGNMLTTRLKYDF